MSGTDSCICQQRGECPARCGVPERVSPPLQYIDIPLHHVRGTISRAAIAGASQQCTDARAIGVGWVDIEHIEFRSV